MTVLNFSTSSPDIRVCLHTAEAGLERTVRWNDAENVVRQGWANLSHSSMFEKIPWYKLGRSTESDS